jgi:UDP-N-acetyl-D-glucosamine dehydrogenase
VTPLGALGARLEERLTSRSATVGVVGLGYVGLPLAVAFARAGFLVIGVDADPARAALLASGASPVEDVQTADLRPLVESGRLVVRTAPEALAEADAIVICVPTPLGKSKEPDISFIVAAAEGVARVLAPGRLVVLESTTYPGTTDEVLLPCFSRGGMRVGEEFFLAFSPERIDPGNRTWGLSRIPKVVGGVTPACRQLAGALYGQIIDQIVPVSSTQVAEMVKLFENTFRSVNIALVNELAIMCRRLGMPVWEVIAAAATKPFGFMPF